MNDEQVFHDDQKPPTEQLDCFLDKERPCGPACTAFLPVASPELADRVQGRCLVLKSLHGITTSLVAIKNKVTQPGIPSVR